MTRERIELNGQDDSRSSPRVRPPRGGDSTLFAPDNQDEISSRIVDLEISDDEAQFLRTQKRIPVRRGPLAKKMANRLKLAIRFALFATMAGAAAITAYGYAAHAARFRIGSSDEIEISGVRNTSRAQVMEIAGSDIGRNVFFVPLDDRRRQLERIPWVQSASVMRLLPNRIAVEITERVPVAKVQIGNRINLIDANGVVLGPPASRQTKYSFPVIHGITESEPLSSRAAVMKTYNRLIGELDANPPDQYSRQLSEVDLSDPEDVRVTAEDGAGTVVIHLGNSDFLRRYRMFAEHVNEWRRQAGSLQSVDLRYEGQVIVNPDLPKSGEQDKSGDRGIGGSSDVKTKAAMRTKTPSLRAKSQKPRAKSQKQVARSRKPAAN